MVSYAQNHEDVLLDRLFPRGKPGFYIDVGANEPVRNSVTKHFYDLGWHGINVEPALDPFEQLVEARQRDVNLNVAVSDEEGELLFFEFPGEVSGASTFSETNAARHQSAGLPFVERKVPTLTLAQICERHVDGAIDFLSVDVEGHELHVLRGGDWTRWRPRVVLVEATEPTTPVPVHERWEHLLLEAGYLFAAFDGLNRYYVRSEDADLAPVLAVPVNVTDLYVPHGYSRQIEDLRWSLDDYARRLAESQRLEAAGREVNQSLLRSFHGLGEEIRVLRAHYERLERALTATRAQCESLREQLSEAEAAAPRPQPILDELGISPASLGVARRLTALSSRHPKTASSVKGALRMGLKVKRRLIG